MIICTNCRGAEVDNKQSCPKCGSTFSYSNGVYDFISQSSEMDELFSKYLENYTVIASDDMNVRILEDSFLRNQADLILRYAGTISGLDVCDIGIGKGFLLEIIHRKGGAKSITGVEIVRDYLEQIYKNVSSSINLYLANAENMPFVERFDVVFATDILEHVLNPSDFLYCVNKALRKGGKFIVRVPYHEDPHQYSRIQGCKYNFAHLRSYCKSNLVNDLEYSGFKVLCTDYDSFWRYRIKKKFLTNRVKNNFANKLFSYLSGGRDYLSKGSVLGKFIVEPLEVIAVCEKEREL